MIKVVIEQKCSKEMLPIRLRAYERLTLLLERTEPEHLLRDIDLSSLTVQQLSTLLIQKIRQEYDHNLTQQIYVSEGAWERIVNARDQMILFVSTTCRQFPADTPAVEAAKRMLEAYNINGETPDQEALRKLKAEARELF